MTMTMTKTKDVAPKGGSNKKPAPKKFDFDNADFDWDTLNIKHIYGDIVTFEVYDNTTEQTILRGENVTSLGNEERDILEAAIAEG